MPLGVSRGDRHGRRRARRRARRPCPSRVVPVARGRVRHRQPATPVLRRSSNGQHPGLEGQGRDVAVRARLPRELQGAPRRLRAWRGAARAHVRLRHRSAAATLVHRQLSLRGHWKSRSRLADIDSGLCDLRRVLWELEIASVAVPRLGCGLGGPSWSGVRPRIEDALAELPARVLVYEPQRAVSTLNACPTHASRPATTAPCRATLGRYFAPGESASPLRSQGFSASLQEAGVPRRRGA